LRIHHGNANVTAFRQDTKPLVKTIRWPRFGVMKQATLTYAVAPAGLDLATSAAASELQARVKGAARAAGGEIWSPVSWSDP